MTPADKERIGYLVGNPGYTALLSALDEIDTHLLLKLETATGPEEIAQLSLWKASRRYRRVLETLPAELANEGTVSTLFP